MSIDVNQVITVNFSNTLDATKDINNVDNNNLSGLKEGDYFTAKVFSRLTMGQGKTYTIHTYNKQ